MLINSRHHHLLMLCYYIQHTCIYTREDPEKMEFIYENCVFILTCLNFSHLQSSLHLIQYTYRDVFSTAQKFLNSSILMPFSASAIFCFTSSTLAKKKKSLGERSGEQGGWSSEVMLFWSKYPEHFVGCGQVCSWITHHEIGKHIERVFKKNSLSLNAASHNNTSNNAS